MPLLSFCQAPLAASSSHCSFHRGFVNAMVRETWAYLEWSKLLEILISPDYQLPNINDVFWSLYHFNFPPKLSSLALPGVKLFENHSLAQMQNLDGKINTRHSVSIICLEQFVDTPLLNICCCKNTLCELPQQSRPFILFGLMSLKSSAVFKSL